MNKPDDWYQDGFVIAASTGGSIGGTFHAGVVGTVPEFKHQCFTMSPLCVRYRKADGERLAAHLNGDRPMLVRSFSQAFIDLCDGTHPDHPEMKLRPCRHCVIVFNDLGRPRVLEQSPLPVSLRKDAEVAS